MIKINANRMGSESENQLNKKDHNSQKSSRLATREVHNFIHLCLPLPTYFESIYIHRWRELLFHSYQSIVNT